MPDELNDSVKALRTALEIEDNGLKTFLKFAIQTKDSNGKNVFIRLALDEQEHRRIIESQLNNLLQGKTWEVIEIPKSVIEKVSPKIHVEDQRIKGESGLLELDALNTALELERNAARFFKEQAERTENKEAKALFLRLKDWEDAHFNLIQAELDSINGSGMWFGMSEFQMDGKT